jgi:putative flavoprotein involved in K+ transport
MTTEHNPEHIETVIVGGGQAGLAVGRELAKRGEAARILDAHDRVGDAWRTRWYSLRLFTPAKYDGLPGFPFPAPRWAFPTKDEMADYLEAYAERFQLDVDGGVAVDRVTKSENGFVVTAGERRYEANRVVVATGAYRRPRAPSFAAGLDPWIVQVHSSEYRAPSQLRDGGVLVVGAGNSGAEIALELAQTRATWLAGRQVPEIPVRHGSRAARVALPLFRFMGHHVLTRRTPIGRKAGPTLAFGATPLIRTKSDDLAAAGVTRVPKVTGVEDGLPRLEDGRTLNVANVVWATGFRQDFSWIDLPVFGDDGAPLHDRGIVTSMSGLYFVGLPFLYSVTSDTLPGVGRDAKRIARHIARHPAPTPGRSKAPTAKVGRRDPETARA